MQRVEKTVEINAPAEVVFDLFGDFESFPRWMRNVKEVRRTGRKTTHWVGKTVLDADAEWDTEVTVFEPDHRIVWRSIGGDLRADGEAILTVMPEGATELRLIVGYETPGGHSGEDAALFFGWHPEEHLEESLARFTRMAEEDARDEEWKPRRRDEQEDSFADEGRSPVVEEGRESTVAADESVGALEDAPGPGGAEAGIETGAGAGQPESGRHAMSWWDRREESESGRVSAAGSSGAETLSGRGVDRLLDDPPSAQFSRGADGEETT